jgi:hypothetical protein
VRVVPVEIDNELIPVPVMSEVEIVFVWRVAAINCVVVNPFVTIELVIILDTNKFVPVAGPVVISFVI